VVARARIGEAEAHRVGAGVRFTQNTELQIGGGRRFGDPRSLAIQGQLTQPLELTRREPRVRAADAEIDHAKATSEVELRALSFEVTNLFYEARFADLDVELAQRNLDVATRTADAADRRRKAGDITDLDVNLAKIALGRARSTVSAAQAERARAIGKLAALIGARPDDAIRLTGELRPPVITVEALRAGPRAELRALEADARAARAEHALAIANGRPDLGLWAGYQLDEGDAILLGGVTITLPLWSRARGAKAVARAKERRAELERAAVMIVASRQVVDAFEAYTRAREAVEVFDRDVVPTLADSEKLLERSIETGQIAINAYLVARQQVLDGRREHLERQLQLAKAAATARFVAGVTLP